MSRILSPSHCVIIDPAVFLSKNRCQSFVSCVSCNLLQCGCLKSSCRICLIKRTLLFVDLPIGLSQSHQIMSDSGQNLDNTWFVRALAQWQPLNYNEAEAG